MTQASGHLARAVPWTVVTRVLTLVSILAVSAIVYRSLTAERFGLYSVLRTTLQYTMLLVGFGLERSLLRYLPEARARGQFVAMRGIVRRVLGIQGVLSVAWGVVLVVLAVPVAHVLGVSEGAASSTELHWLMFAIATATVFTVGYQTFANVSISAYRTHVVSAASGVRGLLWVALTGWLLALGLDVPGALWAEAISLAIVAGGLGVVAFMALEGDLPVVYGTEEGERRLLPAADVLPMRRQLTYAGVLVWTGIVNLIVSRQSEVFFLAHSHGLAISGEYDLCYSYPQLALEFVPLAAAPVVTSAVAEAFGRDPSSLPGVVTRYFRLLVLLSLPIAVMGALWADRLLVVLFGSRIEGAAHWAQVFSVIHMVPLAFVPLSTALLTVEKAHKLLPLGLLQVGTNIGLDLLLIDRFGFGGAVAAVAITLVTMTPITLYAAYRVLGGLWFPTRYLGRVALGCLPAVVISVLLRFVLPGRAGLAVGIVASLALLVMGLRWVGAVGPSELAMLASIRRRGR